MVEPYQVWSRFETLGKSVHRERLQFFPALFIFQTLLSEQCVFRQRKITLKQYNIFSGINKIQLKHFFKNEIFVLYIYIVSQ